MEFTSKKELESLSNDLLLREAELLRKFVNKCRESLVTIKEVADSRVANGTMEMYDGDLLMSSDRDLLKEAINFLVRLDEVVEDNLPEWRTSADLILEIGDFYNKVENDDELSKCLQK